MSSTLVSLANRSPSRLSSSAERRARPSPTSAIASSSASSSPRRRPIDRASRARPTPTARTTSSTISLPIQSTASGTSERAIRRARIPATYRGSVRHTSRSSRGTCRSAWTRTRQPGSGGAGFRPPRLDRTIGCSSGMAMCRKLIAGEAPMPHLDWPALWTNLPTLWHNLIQFGAPDTERFPSRSWRR